jgi:hypothetical protein
MTRETGAGIVVFATALAAAHVFAQNSGTFLPRDHAAIQYSTRAATDPVAELNQQIRRGQRRLSFDKSHGYLGSILAAFDIPPSSQTLVFSENSLHRERISLAMPRALYFNDSVTVGLVNGADTVEIAAQDPTQGVVFYQLSQTPQQTPQFVRSAQCLQCHLTAETSGVPGLFVMSVLPLSDNKNEYAQGWATDHRTPIEDRWGGWYVTGTQVPRRHLGNVPVTHVPKSYVRADVAPQLTSGAGAFDTRGYLSPYSDVVALLVLNHQVHAVNLLTRLGWESRIADYDARSGKASGQPSRVRDVARELVDYLLFVDEAVLPSAVRGSSSFAQEFSSKGPRDSTGRSLRDLDLTRRLFRYPCSYMIYSEPFDALPTSTKSLVYQRLWEILSGKDTDKAYARLSLTDRRAIAEILRATKKDLPAYFQGR